ncbi:type II toxin-antitoxin system RelE/ParE family toxin [Parabacteroides sp. OttesenSCG-928-G06]|nr:type II toxin-antitoxin system RelE/ParE family toxin [Parabacteroides sp. OttesenSCG-928-K15]MDL2282389.1 type II toxin-antitoxin system RelE/ParE family toxin [Parabacteroides sp. OttesenSCG-928-G06]
MVIQWSDLAATRLEEIALYYKHERSTKAARKVISQIKEATNTLKDFPRIAAIESLLSDHPETFRSLIISDIYKVVYYIDEEIVRIVTIFDCRQNPERLYDEVKAFHS